MREKTQNEETQRPVNFPPRKRSIPYGFDFDLDEVWAPLNPHLRGFRAEASTSSSASSSDNSLHGRSLPMQSSSVLGDSSDTRASTARLPGRGKHSEDSDEFAVENEDIFMQINSLTLGEDDPSEDASKDQEVVITNVGLPSAKTLRGGTTIVAKGRHGLKANESSAPHSAISSYSNSRFQEGSRIHTSYSESYSTTSSRFNSGGTISPARSPALSRRYQNSPGLNPGLTPGLVGEHRKSKPNSTSPRKSAPPGQFKF